MPSYSLPSATGLMIFARREGQIDLLLGGLSNLDDGIRAQTVRTVLLAYYQKAMDLGKASKKIDEVPDVTLQTLTRQMVDLAERYNWQ